MLAMRPCDRVPDVESKVGVRSRYPPDRIGDRPDGGFVSVRIEGDRVMIGGKAVTVPNGQLLA